MRSSIVSHGRAAAKGAAGIRAPASARDIARGELPLGAVLHDARAGSACACGGGCPRCAAKDAARGRPLSAALRSRFEAAQHADFSGVRVHPDAPEITAPLAARAVTRGQDIYFHPGQFNGDTPRGKALLAHELAHTLQTRAAQDADATSTSVSRPGDALEKNADALASGATRQALAAPAGAALRSPFDSETPDQRTRREALLQSISNATDRLVRMLQTGGLLHGVETPVTRNGVQGIAYAAVQANAANAPFISYPDRDVLVRRIIRSLIAMGTLYRSAPVPADFDPPTQTPSGEYQSTVKYPPGSGTSSVGYGGGTAEWADLQAAYERYRITQKQTGPAYDSDWYYLDPSTAIDPGAARGAPRISGAIQTGRQLVVPDIDNEPLRYWPLTGSSPTPKGSTIVELWHDGLGHYYLDNKGRRVNVPEP